MKLAVGARADPVVFLEGAPEVLTAVVAGLKSYIRDGERAVDQEEDGMLQAFAVDIIGDRAIHVPGEQGLQLGFVDPGALCKRRDPYLFRQVGCDVILCPPQIEHSGILAVTLDAF